MPEFEVTVYREVKQKAVVVIPQVSAAEARMTADAMYRTGATFAWSDCGAGHNFDTGAIKLMRIFEVVVGQDIPTYGRIQIGAESAVAAEAKIEAILAGGKGPPITDWKPAPELSSEFRVVTGCTQEITE